jgi:hypothetical protein
MLHRAWRKFQNSAFEITVDLLGQLDHDPGAPPKEAWRRKLNSHVNFLTEFKVTFMEAIRMVLYLSQLTFPISRNMLSAASQQETTIMSLRCLSLQFNLRKCIKTCVCCCNLDMLLQLQLGLRMWFYVQSERAHGRVTSDSRNLCRLCTNYFDVGCPAQ